MGWAGVKDRFTVGELVLDTFVFFPFYFFLLFALHIRYQLNEMLCWRHVFLAQFLFRSLLARPDGRDSELAPAACLIS
jgi:hypothetical protein